MYIFCISSLDGALPHPGSSTHVAWMGYFVRNVAWMGYFVLNPGEIPIFYNRSQITSKAINAIKSRANIPMLKKLLLQFSFEKKEVFVRKACMSHKIKNIAKTSVKICPKSNIRFFALCI